MTEYHHFDRAGDAGVAPRRWTDSDHEEINRARQAAEALFAPKPRSIEPPAASTASPADQTTRKPRILSAVQVQPTRVQLTEAPVVSVRPKPVANIPASHLDRIRTWLRYGMTMAQVADVYRVTIGDIERMTQKA